jgi:hypothetical protein
MSTYNDRKWTLYNDSLKILQDNNIPYTLFNNGMHVIIVKSYKQIHFWPTTGKVWFPEKELKGRGIDVVLKIYNSIEEIQEQPKKKIKITFWRKVINFFINMFKIIKGK